MAIRIGFLAAGQLLGAVIQECDLDPSDEHVRLDDAMTRYRLARPRNVLELKMQKCVGVWMIGFSVLGFLVAWVPCLLWKQVLQDGDRDQAFESRASPQDSPRATIWIGFLGAAVS